MLFPEHAHTTFDCVLTRSFYKYRNEISLQHCCVVFCIIIIVIVIIIVIIIMIPCFHLEIKTLD